ncbi:hypothetical protein [Oceanobacillus bengalensis]|nr:hypothetical protein [Oceanobacillus bengalensis]
MNNQELENWADQLLAEYEDSRRYLGRMKDSFDHAINELMKLIWKQYQ